MSDGLTVPPNWRHDDPEYEEDVGRKYDPHPVIEYEHIDRDIWVVLAPGRVPDRVDDSNKGYRVDLRHGSGPEDVTTIQIAAVPSLADAHHVAEDLMRLFTEFHTGGARIDRVVDDIAASKADAWRAEADAVRPSAAAAPV
ncbi:hypothetical protein [Salarchaeum japonicum]|uniref:Uncharacterized protein n=1 Tax=Salarchaeum japonicum TaxID=555573 RepID=A0AAV3SYV8_9EURY|nr:hypothetical protein [Salarchaeum japonicum]